MFGIRARRGQKEDERARVSENPRQTSRKKTPISIAVDGRAVSADRSRRLIDICIEQGADIPALCYEKGLPCAGTCRVCLVECNGQPVAACHTYPAPEMRVRTRSPKIDRLRRDVLKLILSETGPALPGSKLERLAAALSVTAPQAALLPGRSAPDTRHPYLHADFSRCIVCQLCIAACQQAAGKNVFSLTGSGLSARVQITHDMGLLAAGCVSCGACAQVCPSGVLQEADLSLFDSLSGIDGSALRKVVSQNDRVDSGYPWLLLASKTKVSTSQPVSGLGIHPSDAARLRVAIGAPVEIIGRRGKFRSKAVLTARVPRGTLCLSADAALENFFIEKAAWKAAAVRIRKLNALEAGLPGDAEFELRPPNAPAEPAGRNRRRFVRGKGAPLP
jgi:predicted molibdopterin-dependent oxidoreductase YjgC